MSALRYPRKRKALAAVAEETAELKTGVKTEAVKPNKRKEKMKSIDKDEAAMLAAAAVEGQKPAKRTRSSAKK